MSTKGEPTPEMVVAVERDSANGKLFSCIRPHPERRSYDGQYFVVDRQHGRQMDTDAVRSRAKSLAIMLGFRYLEDLRWRCAANRLMPCRCPICCGATSGMEPAPDPEPVRLDARTREAVSS